MTTPMTSDQPEVLAERENVDLAQERLSADINALADKTNPRAIIHRRKRRIGGMIAGAKNRMMRMAFGATAEGTMRMRSTMDMLTTTAGSTPRQARRWAHDNPLAVGLIVFGLGWLIGSITPESEAEHKAASRIAEQVSQ